jgi:hypothetical protein
MTARSDEAVQTASPRRARQGRCGTAFEQYVQGTIGKLSQGDKTELTRLLDQLSDNIKYLLDTDSPESEVPVL